MSASFDDPNLVSTAGLVPIMRLADEAGLPALAQNRLSVPTDKGSNAGAKIASLVSGMSTLFDRIYELSTLGSFLRTFTFGHVRQLDAVASWFLVGLARQAPNLVPAPAVCSGSGYVFVDVDDTIIEVHGHKSRAWASDTRRSGGSTRCWPRRPLPTRRR